MVTILRERRDFITPFRFGAVGDAEVFSNMVTTSASNVVNNTTDSPFKPTHVGKPIYLVGAGASGNVLISTITAYVSATQIQIGATASTAGTMRGLIGTDDTNAILAALAYARTRSRAVRLDGAFISQPLLLKSRSALIGQGKLTTQLFLKPGSATASKFLLRNETTTDFGISIEEMTINALRDFQKDGSNAILTDINGLEHLGSLGDTSVLEVYNTYRGLNIVNAGRAGLKYYGRGKSRFSDIVIEGSIYGLDLSSAENHISDVSVKASGSGFYLGIYTAGSRFTNCKASTCGWAGAVGVPGAGETSCWYLNGVIGNDFVNCEGAESWSSVWILNNAKKNSFSGVRASDAGCLYTAHALGATNAAETRAGFRLMGDSSDNRFSAGNVALIAHGTSYMTHAISFEDTSANNAGQIHTTPGVSYATAKIGRTTSAIGNSIRVDAEMVSKERHTIPLHASQFFPKTTAGSQPVEVELPTNKVELPTLNFDPNVVEYAQARVTMPKSYDPGAFSFEVVSSQATTAAGGVTWSVAVAAVADGDPLDAAPGTAVLVNKTHGVANTNYKSNESAQGVIAGSASSQVDLVITLSRAVADAGDTLAQDARFHNMRLHINAKSLNDL